MNTQSFYIIECATDGSVVDTDMWRCEAINAEDATRQYREACAKQGYTPAPSIKVARAA
jgi:hypothetical protein